MWNSQCEMVTDEFIQYTIMELHIYIIAYVYNFYELLKPKFYAFVLVTTNIFQKRRLIKNGSFMCQIQLFFHTSTLLIASSLH